MEFQRSLRIRKPMENPLPHLGKSLSHHQVIPAVQALRSANKPRVDAIKRGFNASAHAGHPLVGAVAKVFVLRWLVRLVPLMLRIY